MSSPRTRLVAGVAAWAAALGAALAVGLTAVGAIGAGLLGAEQQPLTPAEVDARLASAEPGAPAPQTAAPEVLAPEVVAPEVIATAGGTVLARCTADVPEVVSATPAQGFRVQTEDDDGGPRVRFRDGGTRIEVNLRCVDGRPVAGIENDD
jgi:FtsP/CotA-like multicopper oxidase with cupredoxin domain